MVRGPVDQPVALVVEQVAAKSANAAPAVAGPDPAAAAPMARKVSSLATSAAPRMVSQRRSRSLSRAR